MESRRQNPTATTTTTAEKIGQSTNPTAALLLQALMIKQTREEAALAHEIRRDGESLSILRNYIDFNPLVHPPVPFYDLAPEDRVEVADLAAAPNQVFWGKYFLCQTVMMAVGTGMDLEVPVTDPKGILIARLSLHNYYFVDKSLLLLNFEDILPLGSLLVVQNPWFKATGTAEGTFILYAENPEEVQLISKKKVDAKFGGLEWNNEFAKMNIQILERRLFWNQFEDDKATFGKLKELGNKGFGDKRFSDALRFYDMALDYCAGKREDEATIHSSKSAALLALGCFNAAIKSAEAALEVDPENKCYNRRKTKALIGLRKYEEARSFLQQKFDQFPSLNKSKNCKKLLEDVKSLAQRENLGPTESQLLSIRMGTLSPDDVIPEFRGPFVISSEIEEGKGRGLVATEDIRPGQLIICTRAFGYQSRPPASKRFTTYTSINPLFDNPNQEQVVREIANKLAFDPELGPDLYSLTAGAEHGHLEPRDWQGRHVDMQRIMSIVKLNNWSSGEVADEEQFCGLWLVPSFFNHSCSEYNCVWNICGEWMSVRAIAEIKKGDELTVSYISPIESYESRLMTCNELGFICNCALCQLEANEPPSVKNVREKIMEFLDQLSSHSRPREIRKWVKVVANLASLRNDNVALNFPLLSPQIFKLVDILAEKGRIGEALYVLTRMYEVAAVSVCWHHEGLDVAMSLLTRLAERGDKESAKFWMQNVKGLLMKLDGNLETMRIKGKDAVELLKGKLGIDFFQND